MNATTLSSKGRWIDLGARVIVALLLAQSLFFKFTGNEVSVFVFETIGVEPWGRIATGVIELIAAVLVLVPSTAATGALVAAGTMVGAIVSHLMWLGVSVQDDGGGMFGMAIALLVLSLVILVLRKSQIPVIGRGSTASA
jgi:uncharacterized membrane protein YphA (DoxX/SURF4 family)